MIFSRETRPRQRARGGVRSCWSTPSTRARLAILPSPADADIACTRRARSRIRSTSATIGGAPEARRSGHVVRCDVVRARFRLGSRFSTASTAASPYAAASARSTDRETRRDVDATAGLELRSSSAPGSSGFAIATQARPFSRGTIRCLSASARSGRAPRRRGGRRGVELELRGERGQRAPTDTPTRDLTQPTRVPLLSSRLERPLRNRARLNNNAPGPWAGCHHPRLRSTVRANDRGNAGARRWLGSGFGVQFSVFSVQVPLTPDTRYPSPCSCNGAKALRVTPSQRALTRVPPMTSVGQWTWICGSRSSARKILTTQ